MKRIEHQFQRLLRAAAAAWPQTVGDPGKAPDARWLLRQRERELARTQVAARSVLRRSLAFACLLLVATLLVSVRQIRETNADVFAVSETALTRISTP